MSSPSVLIVDDSKNIRLTLEQALSKNYNVLTAANGEDGLEKVEDNDISVILLDYKLPGINGIEFLKKIEDKLGEIQVIIITAFGSIDSALEAMKLGAIDYVEKPFEPETIRNKVKEVIERKGIESGEKELESYDDYLSSAKFYLNKRNFGKAKEMLKKATGLDPEKPEAFNLMGAIFELKGDVSEALKKYRAALALEPSYKPAKTNLERCTKATGVKSERIDLGEE